MQEDIFEKMAARWPSTIVARAEVKNFTGGAISPKTIANTDSQGSGPATRLMIGRRVCYPVADLVDWLRKNTRSGLTTASGTKTKDPNPQNEHSGKEPPIEGTP